MDFNIISFIQGNPVNNAIKIFSLIFMVLFIIYSLLTVRQVSIMNHSLVTRLALEIQMLAWFQLVLGVLALLIILIFS